MQSVRNTTVSPVELQYCFLTCAALLDLQTSLEQSTRLYNLISPPPIYHTRSSSNSPHLFLETFAAKAPRKWHGSHHHPQIPDEYRAGPWSPCSFFLNTSGNVVGLSLAPDLLAAEMVYSLQHSTGQEAMCVAIPQ